VFLLAFLYAVVSIQFLIIEMLSKSNRVEHGMRVAVIGVCTPSLEWQFKIIYSRINNSSWIKILFWCVRSERMLINNTIGDLVIHCVFIYAA
jgi:hypothetical protein